MKIGGKVVVKGTIEQIIEDKNGRWYQVIMDSPSLAYNQVRVKQEDLRVDEEGGENE